MPTASLIRSPRPLLLAGAILASLASGAIQAQSAQPMTAAQIRFDIPAQSAGEALNAFARQSGWRILFPYDEVEGKRTRAIQGVMSSEAALHLLLEDTGLVVASRENGVISLCVGQAGKCTQPVRQTSGAGDGDASQAADQGPATDLQKLVVTAFRREQELQDVPAAMSVLTAETIRAQGAQDFRDYLTSMPGVNFTEGSTGAMRVTIRGVGAFGNDPLTGIYIDETPITESYFATLDPDVYDLDRVEVLRGPQGTLYGSGSMGGTVRIITRKPEMNWFEGSLEATGTSLAHGGWGRRVDGVVNIPLVEDRLALRASAGYRNDDGWIDNSARGTADANTVEKKNLRAQLRYEPSDNTSVTLGFLYQGEDNGATNIEDVAPPDYRIARTFRDFGGSDARLFSLTAEHDFGSATLTSASNFLTKDTFIAADAGANIRTVIGRLLGVTLPSEEGVGVRSDTDFELFTQEVRLASNGGSRFDYVVGGFYSNAISDVNQVFDFSQAPTAAGVQTGADFYTSGQQYDTRQVAAFGELTFHANEYWSFTAGFRAFDFNQRNLTHASGTLNGAESTSVREVSSSSTQQKYLIEFKPTQDNLLYAQASQGYRNGGPTGDFPLAACQDALAELGYTSVPKSYGPDKLWNYEIGSKNSLAGGRATLNGAVYYVDWTDIQLDARLGCGFGLAINAGKAVSKGFELESSIEPIKGLTLTGAVSYTDAKLERSAPGVRAKDGDPIPYVSDWSWNASAQYRFVLANGLNMFVRGEVNHVGNRWNDTRSIGPAAVLLDAYTLVGARVGISRDNWTVALFANNLFDEHIVTQRTSGGIPIETVGRPLTVGITTRLAF